MVHGTRDSSRLLSGAERRKTKAAGSLLAGAFLAIDQIGAAVGIGRGFGQRRASARYERLISGPSCRTTGVPWSIDGETAWNALGTFHKTLQLVTCSTSSSVNPGNLLIAIQTMRRRSRPVPSSRKAWMRPALHSETTSVCATTSTAFDRSESRRVVGSRRLEASTTTKR